MHEFVSFNFEIFKACDPLISAISSSGLYGKGIFTTVAVYDGTPFLWEKHWRRLEDNAVKLGIDLARFSEAKIKNALDAIIRKNSVKNGRLRLTFFDESASQRWFFKTNKATSVLITSGDLAPRRDNFELAILPYIVSSMSPLSGVKSCNYLEKVLALDHVRSQGYDEGLQNNDNGHITSAIMANIFWLKNEVLYTPSLRTGCIPGTTREFVIESLDCTETMAPIRELQGADAIFLTSSGLGVISVAEFESESKQKIDHPILHLLPEGA